eukprot:TRINITY_DN933_c0_g1_i1.p1 TRINITY_DN933_c0_g1~~TRINITY_DN933_c0_g1_i1.p1  ORF type:complete len:198 (+),score=66.68 TRINITY_DN933_c0_g1_i1:30-596(+)
MGLFKKKEQVSEPVVPEEDGWTFVFPPFPESTIDEDLRAAKKSAIKVIGKGVACRAINAGISNAFASSLVGTATTSIDRFMHPGKFTTKTQLLSISQSALKGAEKAMLTSVIQDAIGLTIKKDGAIPHCAAALISGASLTSGDMKERLTSGAYYAGLTLTFDLLAGIPLVQTIGKSEPVEKKDKKKKD